MPKIEFRGQTYNNEFEMPYDVRQAYIKEKERRAEEGQFRDQAVDRSCRHVSRSEGDL